MEKVLKVEILFNFFMRNGYQFLNSNIPIVKFFVKADKDENSVNIVICVSSNSEYYVLKEELDNIAFQIERKYLLSGISKVNMLALVLSDNIDRDKSLSDGNTNLWLLDTLGYRVVVFENQPEDFDNLKQQLDVWCNAAYEVNNQPEKNFFTRTIDKMQKLPLMTILMFLINMLVFVRLIRFGDTTDAEYMLEHGAMYYKKIFDEHEYYRFITCMFMHFDFDHLFSNMISLMLIGNEVERIYGKFKFTCIYMFSGIFGSFLSVLYYSHMMENAVSAGASGAIYGLMGAVLVKIIQEKNRQGGISGKLILVFLFLFMAGRASGNVDNLAHLGGLIGGMIISLIFYLLRPIKRQRMED